MTVTRKPTVSHNQKIHFALTKFLKAMNHRIPSELTLCPSESEIFSIKQFSQLFLSGGKTWLLHKVCCRESKGHSGLFSASFSNAVLALTTLHNLFTSSFSSFPVSRSYETRLGGVFLDDVA
jgi:hypothetical protein